MSCFYFNTYNKCLIGYKSNSNRNYCEICYIQIYATCDSDVNS